MSLISGKVSTIIISNISSTSFLSFISETQVSRYVTIFLFPVSFIFSVLWLYCAAFLDSLFIRVSEFTNFSSLLSNLFFNLTFESLILGITFLHF